MSNAFLTRLKAEGKIRLVFPSEEMFLAYILKSEQCFQSAVLLLDHKLFENAVGLSYYAMYNALAAILYFVGIQCKNHTASILLFDLLVENKKLIAMIENAKMERIDKQYCIFDTTSNIAGVTRNLIRDAEQFILEIKILKAHIGEKELRNFKNTFDVHTK